MRKHIALVLALVCALCCSGCGRTEDLKQGDYEARYFFGARVLEAHEDYLLLEVFDTGNTRLSQGAAVEVSTDVAPDRQCPEFAAEEFARVLLERNTGDDAPDRLTAVSIYRIDETGRRLEE